MERKAAIACLFLLLAVVAAAARASAEVAAALSIGDAAAVDGMILLQARPASAGPQLGWFHQPGARGEPAEVHPRVPSARKAVHREG
uniref:Uncharacterized protein n=1 Tax=Leersia perrieri TaxID=77586 RepID=A0A0D9W461_9ORYZ